MSAYVAATGAAAGAASKSAGGPEGEAGKQRDFDFLGAGEAPCAAAYVAPTVAAPPAPALPSKGLPSALRVLAVDDNAICLKVVKKMLEKLGCSVQLANNGLEAVEAVRAAPGGFDFVLMDLRMPVMDGIEATVRIRKELGLTPDGVAQGLSIDQARSFLDVTQVLPPDGGTRAPSRGRGRGQVILPP